jgi:hypothetical protein
LLDVLVHVIWEKDGPKYDFPKTNARQKFGAISYIVLMLAVVGFMIWVMATDYINGFVNTTIVASVSFVLYCFLSFVIKEMIIGTPPPAPLLASYLATHDAKDIYVKNFQNGDVLLCDYYKDYQQMVIKTEKTLMLASAPLVSYGNTWIAYDFKFNDTKESENNNSATN